MKANQTKISDISSTILNKMYHRLQVS